MNLEAAISALKETATFTPEFLPDNVQAETQEGLNVLLSEYPSLVRFPAYLTFLRLTGGAHIHNQDFSLGIYGFGGYVVTSFDEGLFLDKDRYLRVAEILYHQKPEPIYSLAFDLEAESDMVFSSPIENSDYSPCAESFLALLNSLARGLYPHALS